MLLLFREYQLDHPRFRGHARVAYVMAMVVPVCALLVADAIGWWNPWLWSASGAGVALALMLASTVRMQRQPAVLSPTGRRILASSGVWFPYFFVLVQSSIASLIVLFIWFSATSMALPMPAHVHGLVIALAILIPIRRYVAANIQPGSPPVYEKRREQLRGVWHVLVTILITRVIIGLTIPDADHITQGNIAWQTIVWVPAAAYMLFSAAATIEHVRRINLSHATANGKKSPVSPSTDGPLY